MSDFIAPSATVELNDGYSLYPYQENAIAWMKRREQSQIRGGIVCLTMGLGKTLISLHRIAEDRFLGKSLYICDKTVIGEVMNDLAKFFGQHTKLRVLFFHHEFTPKKYLDNFTMADLANYDLIVTTYEAIVKSEKPSGAKERIYVRGEGFFEGKIVSYVHPTTVSADPYHYVGYSLLHQVPWRFIIADEAQKLLNPKNAAFGACASLHGMYKFCLTGTPVRNSDKDMWSLLFFCGMSDVDMPRKWKYETFKESYTDCVLHMKLSDTHLQLPPKEVHEYKLTPNSHERLIYRFYFEELWEQYNKFVNAVSGTGNVESFAVILALFTRLRQICLSSYLITEESKDRDLLSLRQYSPDSQWIPYNMDTVRLTAIFRSEKPHVRKCEKTVHDIIAGGFYATKVNAAMAIIDAVLREPNQKPELPNKVMVFSAFSSLLYLMARYVMSKYQGMPDVMSLFDIIDGKSVGKIRTQKLERFRKSPNCRILFINYKVGAMGLNLTMANHIITMEPWWTPVFESQAVSRAHRPGQKRVVHHHKMVLAGTIEEQINEIGAAKNSIGASYLDTKLDKERVEKPGLDKATLGKILRDAWKELYTEEW